MSSNIVFFFLIAFLATSTFGQAPSPSPALVPSPTATSPSPVSPTGSPTISPTTSYSPAASPINSPAPIYSPNATPPAPVSPTGSHTISSAASGPADDSYDNSANDGFDDKFGGDEAPASSPIHKSSAASLQVSYGGSVASFVASALMM